MSDKIRRQVASLLKAYGVAKPKPKEPKAVKLHTPENVPVIDMVDCSKAESIEDFQARLLSEAHKASLQEKRALEIMDERRAVSSKKVQDYNEKIRKLREDGNKT